VYTSPQAQVAHESLECAASHGNAFRVHLLPDLVGTIDQRVGVPDPLDIRYQLLVLLVPSEAQCRVALLSCMAAVTRQGNLQDLADRLDPLAALVLVDVSL